MFVNANPGELDVDCYDVRSVCGSSVSTRPMSERCGGVRTSGRCVRHSGDGVMLGGLFHCVTTRTH